jgi:hypothetical protein
MRAFCFETEKVDKVCQIAGVWDMEEPKKEPKMETSHEFVLEAFRAAGR